MSQCLLNSSGVLGGEDVLDVAVDDGLPPWVGVVGGCSCGFEDRAQTRRTASQRAVGLSAVVQGVRRAVGAHSSVCLQGCACDADASAQDGGSWQPRSVYFRRRVVILLLVVGMVWLALHVAHAATPAGGAQYDAETAQVSAMQIITVRAGDSLWSLAAEYGTARDTRDDVVMLREVNDLTSVNLQQGQRLLVPRS